MSYRPAILNHLLDESRESTSRRTDCQVFVGSGRVYSHHGICISGELDGNLIELPGSGHDSIAALESLAVVAQGAVLVQGIVELVEDDNRAAHDKSVQRGQTEQSGRVEVAVIVNEDRGGRLISGEKIR